MSQQENFKELNDFDETLVSGGRSHKNPWSGFIFTKLPLPIKKSKF